MNVDAYLERIGYGGPASPAPETLRDLHRAHMLAVPFENLDIHLGVPIVLSEPAFFDKIVTRRRGGYCYELNGLFAWLLEQLGFRVRLLSGRVVSLSGLSPEFDHLVLLVELDRRWIADVGFGDSSLAPLPLEPERRGDEDGYSIVGDGGAYVMQRRREGAVEPQFIFELTPHELPDFEERNVFQQTSEESHFTKNAICSRATADGRVSVSGRKLIVTKGEKRTEKRIASAKAYRSTLQKNFGVALTDKEAERLWRAVPPPSK